MKKRLKPAVILSVILSLCMALLFNVSALNTETLTGAGAAEPTFSMTGSGVLQIPDVYAAQADFTVDTYGELIQTVTAQYVARNTEFSVRVNDAGDALLNKLSDSETFWRDVFTCDLPDTTSDIYYLRSNMSGTIRVQYSYDSEKTICEFTQSYYTTAQQEAFVDSTVESVLISLDMDTMNPYEKIKAAHDYIVSNVEYDYSLTKYSAYDALYSGETVCNGYALLTYKMLIEAGVLVKIVTGMATSGGSSENHAWNVVKIGPWWYNLDVTWDDTGRTMDYFLKNEAAFSDHFASAGYPETVYIENFEISPTNFDPTADNLYYDPAEISSWARDGVMTLIERGVVPEALQSDFQNSITRAEFTALIVAIYEYAKGPYTLQNASPFNDISGSAYAEQIAKGYELGLINGYENVSENGVTEYTFKPEGTLTREQCAKIISAAAGVINGSTIESEAALPFGDIASISSWALMFVQYAFENELMNGTGDNFDPQGLLTREQAMLIAERMIVKYGW